MNRVRHFGNIICLSLLLLKSNGYLYNFKRKSGRWRNIKIEQPCKEILNIINILPIPDEVLNEYMNKTNDNVTKPIRLINPRWDCSHYYYYY
jgi:hypothetical protein